MDVRYFSAAIVQNMSRYTRFIYIYFFVFHFYFRIIFFFLIVRSSITIHIYIYIFLFSIIGSFRIGSSLSFIDYYYQFIVVIFLNFVHQDFQREREEKEERERAREIHRVRYEFGRIVYSMFIIIIISSSSSIIP